VFTSYLTLTAGMTLTYWITRSYQNRWNSKCDMTVQCIKKVCKNNLKTTTETLNVFQFKRTFPITNVSVHVHVISTCNEEMQPWVMSKHQPLVSISPATRCHIPEGSKLKLHKLYTHELLLVSFRPSFCLGTTDIGLMHKAIYCDPVFWVCNHIWFDA
jgi:hypothetical protein